jgi:hypothetical protein
MSTPRLIFARALPLGAVVGLFLAACGGPKKKPEEVAQQFLESIKAGKIQTAYAETSFAFQAQQTLKDFDAKVRDLNLDEFQSAKWQRTEDTPDQVTLDGTVSLAKDQQIPLTVTLYAQQRQWLVSAISTSALGEDGQPVQFSSLGQPYQYARSLRRDLPGENDLRALVKETLKKFDTALEGRDFAEFYSYISSTWQSQISETRFKDAFQQFLDREIHLGGIDAAAITFEEPPRIGSEGILLMSGVCKTTPQAAHFTLKYIYEVPKWRLFAIALEMIKPEEKASPSPAAVASPSPSP